MRNKFEEKVAKTLTGVEYESRKFPYVLACVYNPDFVDEANKVMYESKGFWRAADRRKILNVKRQYPDWTLIMILQDPNKRISKTSKTTYAKWCERNGLEWRKG